MAIAKRFSNLTNITAVEIEEPIIETIPTYERILVLMEGTAATEQALRETFEIATEHGASVVLVSEDTPGSAAYIERTCRQMQGWGIEANGYTISAAVTKLPAWLLNSEKADLVVVAQKKVGWLGRLLGADVANAVRNRTTADVVEVTV